MKRSVDLAKSALSKQFNLSVLGGRLEKWAFYQEELERGKEVEWPFVTAQQWRKLRNTLEGTNLILVDCVSQRE